MDTQRNDTHTYTHKKKKVEKGDMLARNSFFIGPLIGRDGCRPEVFFFFFSPLVFISFLSLFFFRSTRGKRISGRYPPISNSSAI